MSAPALINRSGGLPGPGLPSYGTQYPAWTPGRPVGAGNLGPTAWIARDFKAEIKEGQATAGPLAKAIMRAADNSTTAPIGASNRFYHQTWRDLNGRGMTPESNSFVNRNALFNPTPGPIPKPSALPQVRFQDDKERVYHDPANSRTVWTLYPELMKRRDVSEQNLAKGQQMFFRGRDDRQVAQSLTVSEHSRPSTHVRAITMLNCELYLAGEAGQRRTKKDAHVPLVTEQQWIYAGSLCGTRFLNHDPNGDLPLSTMEIVGVTDPVFNIWMACEPRLRTGSWLHLVYRLVPKDEKRFERLDEAIFAIERYKNEEPSKKRAAKIMKELDFIDSVYNPPQQAAAGDGSGGNAPPPSLGSESKEEKKVPEATAQYAGDFIWQWCPFTTLTPEQPPLYVRRGNNPSTGEPWLGKVYTVGFIVTGVDGLDKPSAFTKQVRTAIYGRPDSLNAAYQALFKMEPKCQIALNKLF